MKVITGCRLLFVSFCLWKGIILNGLWEEQSFAHVLSFFFFFRFPNFGWTSVSAFSTMHTRLPVTMTTAVSIHFDID